MNEKEHILLDAHLKSVIDSNAFRAILPNGHELTAFGDAVGFRVNRALCGQSVQVLCSPYDMSKGRIVGIRETES